MCLNPWYKNYHIDPRSGDFIIDFSRDGCWRTPGDRIMKFKCNKCVECMQQATTEWANRCYLESKHWQDKCVLTLTYNEQFVPKQLEKRDYQLFLKRLRRMISPAKIKYFCSGEYGSKNGRPHFHIVIFGWCPDDCVFYKSTSKGTSLYNSKICDFLWSEVFEGLDEEGNYVKRYYNKGFVTVDPCVSYESCFYSAKYMQKVMYEETEEVTQPPFIAMSKGIAINEADAFDPFKSPYIYINGKRKLAPRYFYKRAWLRFGDGFRQIFLQNMPIYPEDGIFIPLQQRYCNIETFKRRDAKIIDNENRGRLALKKIMLKM